MSRFRFEQWAQFNRRRITSLEDGERVSLPLGAVHKQLEQSDPEITIDDLAETLLRARSVGDLVGAGHGFVAELERT